MSKYLFTCKCGFKTVFIEKSAGVSCKIQCSKCSNHVTIQVAPKGVSLKEGYGISYYDIWLRGLYYPMTNAEIHRELLGKNKINH